MFFFVYGTLKIGHSNNYLVAENGMYLGDGVTVDEKWSLYSNTVFPAAWYGDGPVGIYGQVWSPQDGYEKETLADLDFLEGYPRFYARKLVDIQVGINTMECYMYHISRKPEGSIHLTRGVF